MGDINQKINLNINDNEFRQKINGLRKQVNDLKSAYLNSDNSKERLETLKKINDAQKKFNDEKLKEARLEERITHTKLKAGLKAVGKGTASFAKDYFGNIFGGDLLSGIKDLTKSMIDLKTGVATWSAGSSLVMNQQARNLQLQYGLSGSQAYAFKTAGSMLGIDVTNPEDLAFMNPAQREKLSEYMDKYSAWYDKMEASGLFNNIQDLQIGFQELQQDLSMEFLQWIGNNKDVILGAATGALNVLKWIGDMVSSFVGSSYNADNLVGERKVTNVTINSSFTDNSGNGASAQDMFIANVKQAIYNI